MRKKVGRKCKKVIDLLKDSNEVSMMMLAMSSKLKLALSRISHFYYLACIQTSIFSIVDPGFLYLCTHLGPLASFESLLSLYGEDVSIFNDMIVAVEDLRNVEFTLIPVDERRKIRGRSNNMVICHSFPLPRVTGSRSALKVMLPVPDHVYTMMPLEQVRKKSRLTKHPELRPH